MSRHTAIPPGDGESRTTNADAEAGAPAGTSGTGPTSGASATSETTASAGTSAASGTAERSGAARTPGSAGQWSTHHLEFGPARVTKRYRGEDAAARAAAEWRALDVLHRHAPGLAPVPLSPRPTARRPEVVMSRLNGEPLRGTPVDGARLAALVAAVTRLHDAVPAGAVAALPPRPGRPHELAAQIRSLAPHVRARCAGGGAESVVGDASAAADLAFAVDGGLAWLASVEPLTDAGAGPAVLGHGDGNLANYLWDGARVTVVDFEYAGAADRPLELAEITEHIAARTRPALDADAFLAGFDLTTGEVRRLRTLRTLLALHWLCRLALDDPAAPRNPPGTAARQAARLRSLTDPAR